MKQIFQNISKGYSEVTSVPRPGCKKGHLLIETDVTLISAGTERMLVDFGRAGYLQKAKQQPDKVRMVLDKVRTDGLLPTVEAVRSKLDTPLPMGYSNVGIVVEVGEGVTGFQPGDRVLSNGPHAEFVCVGKNLCARVPDGLAEDSAVFGVVGSIAMQGVRLAAPDAGECFAVVGLGLIGLLTVQVLRASGCRVLGVDFDDSKLEIARSYGATVANAGTDNVLSMADVFSRGRGVDGVLITASTDSNEPVSDAAKMCRKRGRIVLVGVAGLNLNRADFFEKELTFQVSCSYGPGRYDSVYEEAGNDYPLGYVRWTEQRNFEAVLDLMASGHISVGALKSARFPIADAAAAYEHLSQDRSALGILIDFATREGKDDTCVVLQGDDTGQIESEGTPGTIGAIGAGNYAGRVLLPAFKSAGASLHTIVSSGGASSSHVGRKLGFAYSSTDVTKVAANDAIDTVVIATQHDSHAAMTVEALNAGKHVFVEKPLALTLDELDAVRHAYDAARGRGGNLLLMVGFNRRFAPLIERLKHELERSPDPVSIVYTCNAGHIPRDSWVQDFAKGGGRIVGEACHFIDLSRFLAASPIMDLHVAAMKRGNGTIDCRDTVSFSMTFENGSIATVHYFANGHRSYPKERIEVFSGGTVFQVENFRRLKVHGRKGASVSRWGQDKGQANCCARFVEAIRSGGNAPIPIGELFEVSRFSIEAARQALETTHSR